MPLNTKQRDLFKEIKSFNQSEDKTKTRHKIFLMFSEMSLVFFEDKTNYSVLHRAVLVGSIELIEGILKEHDAEDIIDKKTAKGNSAIRLAANGGEVDIFKKLHKAGAKYSLADILKLVQEKIDASATAENFEEIKDFIQKNSPKKIKKKKNEDDVLGIYGYPSVMKKQAQEKEYKSQVNVTARFFRVGKPLELNKNSTKLYGEILTAIDMKWPVKLDGYSARAVVICVSKLLQKFEKFPAVIFKLGETELSCTPSNEDVRKRQVGNLLVTIKNIKCCPRYGAEVMEYFSKAFGKKPERQKKIGDLLQEYSKKMTSFSIKDFNVDGRIKLEAENQYQLKNNAEDQVVNHAIHVLNFLNFMYVVAEVTRRLYRDKNGQLAAPPSFPLYAYPEPKSSDNFPVASFHARAIELMRIGTISFNDLYGNSGANYAERPKYGVVSGTDTIRHIETQVKGKGFDINDLMSKYHANKYALKYSQQYPTDYLVTRSPWIRHELGDQFGGDSESDDSSYESAQSDTEYLSDYEESADELTVEGIKL